jgi:hypothetical protein
MTFGEYKPEWANNTLGPRKFNEAGHIDFLKEEIIVTDPNTGGMKASKPSQLGFIDPVALEELGNIAGMGAEKYEPWNYLKGYNYSLSYNAMLRHMNAYWRGEDLDPESGRHHMGHAAWHGLAIVSFDIRGIGNDDRFRHAN